MYQGSNKTALCSQKNIAEGFYELLKEKEYSKITASEICKKSGVSRQTFYSLFSSKENIVSFILSKEYSFNPSEECNCCGRPTLKELSKGFSSFIVQKGDFIDLLVKNNIIYMMQDSLYSSFNCCRNKDSDISSCDFKESDLANDFIASGLTTIAKHYVKNRSDISCQQLEDAIYMLFSGEYLS
ncbi:MAG: TetR/AcrR family transcriptional regulator [Lachnospiraceae bacterium]|nr:TetR/AcrR family transcriptional regulator [Lachnospiraceae bacterium]MDN4745404.1 TetR/AcrR family transcriptional regulator [Lachnospiraceae bacterium C1.1]